MAQSFTNLLYHVIFSTKDRRPLIKPDYQPRFYDYIGGIIRGVGGIPLGINGVEDHVHVLAKLSPVRALSDVIRDVKANASGWMHELFLELKHFTWQRGYAAFTVSHSLVGSVQGYIASEEEHHRRVSFRDEFIQFLKANNVDFDDRFI
jgi:putative transposase